MISRTTVDPLFRTASAQSPARTLASSLFFAAVVLLPFQQALTINVGFPLKLSEIFAIAAMLLMALEFQRGRYRLVGFPLVLLFLALIVLSSIIVAATTPAASVAPGYWRSLNADLWQYTVYAAFVVSVFYVAATRIGARRIQIALAIAVKVAAAYCVLQIVAHSVGSDLLSTVNGATQTGGAYGVQLPRNGPFLEGNYLGFFAGAVLLITWALKDRLSQVASVFCLLYSQSTIGILALVLAILTIAIIRPNNRVFALVAALIAVTIGGYLLVPQANAFVLQQLAKLSLVDSGASVAASYSIRARSVNSEVGISMATAHPIWGVGAGRYGALYFQFLDFAKVPFGFAKGVERPIANNSYVQIMAEQGFLAFTVFAAFLTRVAWAMRKAGRSDIAALVFFLVGFAATPAWTTLPIWIFLAYLATKAFEAEQGLAASARPLREGARE
jgi:hypothetical protein